MCFHLFLLVVPGIAMEEFLIIIMPLTWPSMGLAVYGIYLAGKSLEEIGKSDASSL